MKNENNTAIIDEKDSYGVTMQNAVIDATQEMLVDLHLKQSFC